jgi:hypothetical protein
MNSCKCGCGVVVKGRFKRGHSSKLHISGFQKGHIISQKIREQRRTRWLSDSNPNWKGDDVGKGTALHEWIKRRLIKPDKCEHCKKSKSLELANKSGKYLRILTDWLWLCRSCHCNYDKIGTKAWVVRRMKKAIKI